MDNIVTSQSEWEKLSPEEKKKQLFLKQKHTLDLFLERNAISQTQYDAISSYLVYLELDLTKLAHG